MKTIEFKFTDEEWKNFIREFGFNTYFEDQQQKQQLKQEIENLRKEYSEIIESLQEELATLKKERDNQEYILRIYEKKLGIDDDN